MRRALALLTTTLACAAPAAAAGPTPPLGHVGRWITDHRGRVVILHGFNMVYKRPPYSPRTVGFGADDARFLGRHGFNGVRLGMIYEGVEPRPGQYSGRYLRRIASTERTLARHGIFSLLDFHQDLYNERFQGEGWPDWAVQDDGLPNPQNGFPGNYVSNPALNRAFDHFWANDPGPGGIGLMRRYAAAWRYVASRFRPASHVLGYDIMNEPWPGSAWPTCANPPGCPAFDTGPLATMTRNTTRAIRRVDRRHVVWHEPNVFFDFGAQTSLPRIGSNSGLSFHDYCLPGAIGGSTGSSCETAENLPFQNAQGHTRQTGDALLLTEFGSTDDLPTLRRVATLADQHMVGWLEWSYCGCKDPTGSIPPAIEGLVKDPAKRPRGKNVKWRKLRVLERPYPTAVAGTPADFSYRPSTHVFHLDYRTRAPSGHRLPRGVQTRIYVPRSHYRHGYQAHVDGARVISEPNARYLTLRRLRGAGEVTVQVKPRKP
jgi:endoglycosylceramidase